MMFLFPVLIAVVLASSGSAVELNQKILSIVKSEQKSATFNCEATGLTNSYIHWYRQKADGKFERILYYNKDSSTTTRDPGFTDKYIAEKSNDNEAFTLRVHKIVGDDEGTYYCAHWDTCGAWVKYFGRGTKLIVTNKDKAPQEPEVIVLKPSPQSIKENENAVLFCLAQNFFPGVIRVNWKKGDTDVSEHVTTEEVVDDAGTYSVSSWLRVSKDNKEEYTCYIEHQTKNKPAVLADAPVRPTATVSTCVPQERNDTILEPDQRSSTFQVATLTYVLLLLKSLMYSMIVSYFVYNLTLAPASPRKKMVK